MTRYRRAVARGDYARACIILSRREARRETVWHYRHAIILTAWMPAIAVWFYLLDGILP